MAEDRYKELRSAQVFALLDEIRPLVAKADGFAKGPLTTWLGTDPSEADRRLVAAALTSLAGAGWSAAFITLRGPEAATSEAGCSRAVQMVEELARGV